MWNFLIFFCLGGYFVLLIFLCIFVHRCQDLHYELEDLNDKLFLLELEVFPNYSDHHSRGDRAFCVSEDPEDPEVR